MGFLSQPYTSAGRIPADKGYRYYVDSVLKEVIKFMMPRRHQISRVKLDIDRDMEIEEILQHSSAELSRLTNYLSMVVAPDINRSRFRHVELLSFHENNYLLVLITDTGRVFKRHFYFEVFLNDLDIQKITNILNSQLRDKVIGEIAIEDLSIPDGDRYLFLPLSKILQQIKSCVKDELGYNRVFVHGASAVLNQPEFIDMKKVRGILGIIEDENLLAGILMRILEGENFIVKIGSEISKEGTEDLSLVASKYKISNSSSGAVGILGPKRMDYLKVVSTINMFIKDLREVFSERI
jgi:heat-inducible transcriptional repressor